MLVLTTMFINVSNNLPKTSYVKMIDVWLIFNLLLPFIEVLVHTYMDTLRSIFLVFLEPHAFFLLALPVENQNEKGQ